MFFDQPPERFRFTKTGSKDVLKDLDIRHSRIVVSYSSLVPLEVEDIKNIGDDLMLSLLVYLFRPPKIAKKNVFNFSVPPK